MKIEQYVSLYSLDKITKTNNKYLAMVFILLFRGIQTNSFKTINLCLYSLKEKLLLITIYIYLVL